MNRTRLMIIGSVSLILSVLVTFVAYIMLQGRVQQPEDSIDVVVATRELPLGKMIVNEDVTLMRWPKSLQIEGMFAATSDAIGRGVVVSMLPNEPLLEAKLAPIEAGAGITPIIPDGMRAMSIQVNDVVGVAGFVLPGTRVDLILTGSPKQDGKLASKVILENLRVLAAGQNVQRDGNGTPQTVQVVTVLVSPGQAQKIALATSDGPIRLALRNPLDMETLEPELVQRAALYFGKPTDPKRTIRKREPVRIAPIPSAPALETPEMFVVELIQGSRRASETFEKPGQ